MNHKKGYFLLNPPSQKTINVKDGDYTALGDLCLSKSAKKNKLEGTLTEQAMRVAKNLPQGYRIRIDIKKVWK